MTEFRSIKRRGFLGGALAAFPLAFLGQSPKEPSAMAVAPVRAGEDRLGEPHTIGISSTAFKVLTADSAGALFLFLVRFAFFVTSPAVQPAVQPAQLRRAQQHQEPAQLCPDPA